MANKQNNLQRGERSSVNRTADQRKGDTNRTSNQGRKLASGGSTETNNQGRPKGRRGEGGDTIGNP